MQLAPDIWKRKKLQFVRSKSLDEPLNPSDKSTIVSWLGLFLFALVFLRIYFWIMFLNNTYDSKFGQLLKNGLFFYIRTIGWTLLGILMPLSLVALYFIQFYLVWLKYILLVLIIIFVYPIIILIMTLYTTSKFDVYINKDNYKDYFYVVLITIKKPLLSGYFYEIANCVCIV